MDKKEFVQKYILKRVGLTYDLNEQSDIDAFNDFVEYAANQYDLIEKAFEVTPTKNLWDYNDRS